MPEIANLLTSGLEVALFAWLRSDIQKLHEHLDTFAKGVNDRLDTFTKGVNDRLDAIGRDSNDRLNRTTTGFSDGLDASIRDIHDRLDKRFDAVLREIAGLREGMAKMEGWLEGFLAGRRDRDAP